LLVGLPEQNYQALCQRGENRILWLELFGRSVEKSQTRNQFQGVDLAAHQIFHADSPSKLSANRSDDFFIARMEDWITQVSASLAEILRGVSPRRRGATEPFDLGKYVPDPVATFAASPNFREGRVVAGRAPGLSFE